MLLATFFVALLGYVFATTPTAYAADATWEGESLTYDGNTYAVVEPKDKAPALIRDSSAIYQYVDSSVTPNQAHFVYFAADSSDPRAEKEARYIRYTLNPPNDYSSPTIPEPIVVVPAVDVGETDESAFSSSCTIDGIGYIVCPVMNGLAEVMDFVFERIRGFLTVQPITNSVDNPIYRVWQYSRDLANIAFIIGFMVIIYSYLVGGGFNGYEIRKILPRLAVAAILINVSYILCAAAVDISNIAGYGINQLFESVRDDVLPGSSGGGEVNWTSVTTWVLAGGVGVGVLANVLPGATLGSAAAAGLWGLLSPFLVGGALLIMVTFFILAARQAIIILLIAIAPLAFAAFILPNTEKWFERWRSLFFTMLIMFPAFGAVFGAAQLAGEVLIRTATSIEQVILGLGVMVAPLAITPLLLRLGGGVLNRFGGIVNNPQKGIYDRYKNYNNERRQDFLAKQRKINAERNADGTLTGGRNFMRRAAYRQDLKKYNRQRLRDANTEYANRFLEDNDDGYETLASRTRRQYAQARGRSTYTPSYRYGSAEISELKQDSNLLHGYTEARHDEHWQNVLQGDSRRLGMQTATRLAQGRAKIDEERMASDDESFLQQSLNAGVTPRYATLRDAKIQTTVNKGVAEINAAEIDAAAKVALQTTIDNSRELRTMKVRTFSDEKVAESIESRLKSNAQANWNYVSRVDANVQQLRLDEVRATDSAKRVEEQYNSLIENIRAKGGDAPGVLVDVQAGVNNVGVANAIKSIKRDIDVEGQVQGSAKLIQQSDFTDALSKSAQLRQRAAGVDPRGADRVLAAAKAAVTKELITNTDNYQNTLDYSVQSNIDELEARFKALPNDPSYMPQRVAYARLLAKNGSPGASRLMSVLSDYTQGLPPDEDNVMLLKEILGGEQSIRTASRAFEVWANNERDENGQLYANFDAVNNNVGIWKSITGQRFSSLVQPAQEHALRLLEADDKANGTNNLQRLVERVSQDPAAMSGIKDKPLRMVQAVLNGQDPSSVQ
mgnify:FL=1